MSYLMWSALAVLALLAAWFSQDAAAGGRLRRMAIPVLGLAFVLVLGAAPQVVTFSHQELLVFLMINVLMVTSYRLLALTGEFSLAHVVIMGVGAYASALLSKKLGVPVPLAILCGAATCSALAAALAFPLFRMKGFYFLIGSFAVGEAIRLSWKWEQLRGLFGGPKGIKSIPAFPDIDLGFVVLDFFEPATYFYMVTLAVAACVWLLWRIERSPIGLAFHAVHWQDRLAASVGVNTWRARMLAFVVASFFAGLAGGLLAHYLTTVNPNRFDVDEMVYVLIWVIVGGMATVWGPIVGLIVLTAINEVVLRDIGINELRPLFYGVVLIFAMLFLPGGLETLLSRLAGWSRRSPTDAAAAAERQAR